VLDIDPRHGGDLQLEELQHMYQALPETGMVLSGGGGQHYYFLTDDAIPACDLAHGVQLLTEGRLVVAPPSLHASGKHYAWEVSHDPDDMPLAPLPGWIRALAVSNHAASATQPAAVLPEVLPDIAVQTLHCSSRIKTLIQTGSDPERPARYPSRSEALFAAIGALIHGGHDDATIASVVLNPAYRISDKPRSQRDPRSPFYEQNIKGWVAKEITRARSKFGQNGHGPGAPDAPPASDPEGWRQHVLTKKNGDPLMTLGNIGLILRHHPHWVARFWWDTVRSLPMLDEDALTDEKITAIAEWLGVEARMILSATKPVRECILVLCRERERDLLREWLESLPTWDGVPRLHDWLHDVAETETSLYGQHVSRILPLSMVARALEPGCHYRYVVILQGPENTGKSRLVRTLASPAWYVELTSSLENKESHMTIQGAWLAEMAELDSLNRTEETRLKAFITLQADSWIPKYSNFRLTVPRRTILIGTTNEEVYLKGQTGNTRYLPITTGQIDVEGLAAIREQLFAEALQTYRREPQTWWLFPEEALAEAATAREQRRITSIYEDELAAWLERGRFDEWEAHAERPLPIAGQTTWREIAMGFLHLEHPDQWKDMGLQKQIASSLKSTGWRRSVRWTQGKPLRIWEYAPPQG